MAKRQKQANIEASKPEEMEVIIPELITEETPNQVIRYNIMLHTSIIKAIKVMAAHEGNTIQDYLNNFFKNFLCYQAEVWKDHNLEAMVKEILKDVPFK